MTPTSYITDIARQFPILQQKINGAKLVYFDNGATTQKPQSVIDAITDYYKHDNANIHRGVHTLSRRATEAFESARKRVASFFNVADEQQCIFTAGTTDGINMVAQGLARGVLNQGDEIIVTSLEHHSNILPWQLWAEEHNGRLKVVPLLKDHSLDYGAMEGLISERTRLVVVAQVSNTLGLISDIKRIKELIKDKNILLMVDGAQSAPHMQIDLAALDPDFFVCSAHKMYGPTGVGMLYLSERWLRDLAQSRTGGGTIKTVSFEKTEYAEGSLRFEPGTPNIEGVIGFAAAVDFMRSVGMTEIEEYEHGLTQYAQSRLLEIPQIGIYGVNERKAAVISFNVKGHHPFDVGTLLDKYGIAVRTGHHCTQPLMHCLNVPGTVRVSFALYNTREEIDYFIEKLEKVIKMLG